MEVMVNIKKPCLRFSFGYSIYPVQIQRAGYYVLRGMHMLFFFLTSEVLYVHPAHWVCYYSGSLMPRPTFNAR
jgi:hypothetical protein